MNFYFGDWILEQRKIRGLSQTALVSLTNHQIPQSTISSWERKEILTPSIKNIWIISNALNVPLSDIPWNYLNLGFSEEKTGGCVVKEKFSLYELPTASSVKTFDGKIYELKGFVGVERETGEIKHITDLYYRTRTVVADSKILAKRKKQDEDLVKVKREKKIKAR